MAEIKVIYKKKRAKILDDLVNQLINDCQNCNSIGDQFKAWNRFRSDLFKNSLGLMHCLWRQNFVSEIIETGLINDEEFVSAEFEDEFFKKKKRFVQRFKQLRKSFITTTPSERVQSHILEACRCFLFGFDQAAIALCRATLDFALRDRLQISGELAYLIEHAKTQGFISDDERRRSADRVREIGNRVMHVSPTISNALNVINDTKLVLEDILRPR